MLFEFYQEIFKKYLKLSSVLTQVRDESRDFLLYGKEIIYIVAVAIIRAILNYFSLKWNSLKISFPDWLLKKNAT